MADSDKTLAELWMQAPRSGTLCAREQAKSWALREVWQTANMQRAKAVKPRGKGSSKSVNRARVKKAGKPKQEQKTYGMLEYVRSRVKTSGPGSHHPCCNSLKQLFEKIDNDKDWYPGKRDPDARVTGPKPVLYGARRTAVASAAMALKRRGREPTYPAIVSQCQAAVCNPDTGHAVDKKAAYKVIGEDCYDDDPDRPWRNQPRVSKKALTAAAMLRRFAFAKEVQLFCALRKSPTWQFTNIVWTDICNSVIARTEKKKADEQALARKGGKGWMSDGSRYNPENLRGDPTALKMAGSGTERIYWAPMLTRGKLHVELLPPGFPGDTEEGAAVLVQKVRAALNVRFPDRTDQPCIIATDRGNGFYVQITGEVTPMYAAALREHGLRNYVGRNCGAQPGQMGDVLLHETAVSWIRLNERRTVPLRAWEETREEFGHRIKEIVSGINREYDVEGLCREIPQRIQALVDGEGAKLKK